MLRDFSIQLQSMGFSWKISRFGNSGFLSLQGKNVMIKQQKNNKTSHLFLISQGIFIQRVTGQEMKWKYQ